MWYLLFRSLVSVPSVEVVGSASAGSLAQQLVQGGSVIILSGG